MAVFPEDISIKFADSKVSTTDLRSKHEDNSLSGYIDLRVVPLFTLSPVRRGQRTVSVGHCVIALSRAGRYSFEIRVSDIWNIAADPKESKKGRSEKHQVVEHYREELPEVEMQDGLLDAVRSDIQLILDENFVLDEENSLPKIAKVLCEMSRENVAKIRDMRYALEADFAAASEGSSSSSDYTCIIALLLQFNIISSKVSDQAREAVREGLWSFICHSDVYHSYRKLQDPSLLNNYKPATMETSTWIRSHDAAIRQCIHLQEQMEQESQTIQALISSATGISSSREADSQSRFNLLVALVSIGIGIPALFLAMYGASDVFGFDTISPLGALVPVGISLLLAALVALIKAPPGGTRNLWYWCATITLLLLTTLVVMVLLFATSASK